MAHKHAARRSYSARSLRSGQRTADRVHNVFVQAGKNRFSMEDICPCCNPGYDGALRCQPRAVVVRVQCFCALPAAR